MSRKLVALAAVAALAACQDIPDTMEPDLTPEFTVNGQETAAAFVAFLDGINVSLAAAGADYRAFKAEYVTDAGSNEVGNQVLAKDVGNKQLGDDFVPNDPRRAWGAPGVITYAIDQTADGVPLGGGLSLGQVDAAIERAMQTWEELACSDLGLQRNPDFGIDIGVAAWQTLPSDGSPFVFADIQHAGWLVPLDFGGGVLGATITFIWVNTGTGEPTDIDGNGLNDVAFREIYYDNYQGGFGPIRPWADDGVSNIDVETVAAHEVGHGLSQGHFGSVRIQDRGRNGQFLVASPRAMMNALYAGPFRNLTGTDNGGHCSIWSDWPDS